MKKVLYVARAGLPVTASGIRIYEIGKMLDKIGYQVHYICNIRVQKEIYNEEFEPLDPKTIKFLKADEIHYKLDNSVYSYLPVSQKTISSKLMDYIEIISARNIYERVTHYCKYESPEAIFLYNDAFSLTNRLIGYCKEHHIKIIGDVTEWYACTGKKNFSNRLIAYLVNCRIYALDKYLDGIIAISSYLETYYQNRGLTCFWIPPIMPITSNLQIEKYEYEAGNKLINIVYAGSPGSKDILYPFIQAIKNINKIERKIRFDIIGVSRDYFPDALLKETDKLSIYIWGYLPHQEVVQIIRKADFGVLLRHDKRYAKAGFSTKFAECMSMGTAMICNPVGGADSIIKNWFNGILVSLNTVEELENVLKQIINLNVNKILEIRTNAYNDACYYFSYKNYIDNLKTLLEITDKK